ncbi:MAG TPA: response regulator [Gemmatimonadaceae bacterium]|nr:response regulator [Gemmatimonadaceae bacterium]
MAEAVKVLVAGLPAEIGREIGLRIRGATVTEFENAQQMGRAASQGEANLVILSDTLPAADSIYVARRARDANEAVRIAFLISMAQAEAALHALKEVSVDRFFFSPVDIEEMLRDLARMCKSEVLAPQSSHVENIAAAVASAWDRARATTLAKIDILDDAAMALLDDSLPVDLKKTAQAESQSVADLAARFGFQRGSGIAHEIAEKFASDSITRVDGVAISEQLLALRTALEGPPQPPAEAHPARDGPARSSRSGAVEAPDDSAVEGAKVLVVDDDAQITRALTTMLARRKISVTAINDPFQFWSALDETKPSLIMLDLEMPRISGTELCRVVRNDRRWSEIPVLFLTGHSDPDSVRRVFAAGADDYVGKPFVPAELMMRIESRLTGVKARRGPVDTDPVTGLPTGGRTTELIERFLRLARRKSDPYSIAVLEVDGFMGLAESYGRSISDRVLRAIGELLPKSFRGEDVVGWWGGAEFLIGMYGSSKEHAAIKLTQICNKVAEQSFLADDGRAVKVQCSGGVSQYQTDGDTVGTLRQKAAEVLRQVREIGLNRVGISGMQLAGPMTRRVDVAIVDDDVALVTMLQHAMESRNFRVATYADGETAVAALTGSTPEVQATVILLGVDLPALNGLDVLRRLKAVEVTRSSSVVMLTSRTGERDVLAALELGATDHIAKPFSVPVLMHKVRMVLRQSS